MELDNRVRVHRVNVRLNDFEYEDLDLIAKETHQSKSNFVRIAILEKKERIRAYYEIKGNDKEDKA